MTLNDILIVERYGEDYMKFENLKNQILENYDNEYDVYYNSKRVKNLEDRMVLENSMEKTIDKIRVLSEAVESRLFDGKPMTAAYKKIQATAIVESCNELIESTNVRSRYNEFKNKEELQKIVASTKYFVETYLNDKAVIKESANSLFNKNVRDEVTNIDKIIRG